MQNEISDKDLKRQIDLLLSDTDMSVPSSDAATTNGKKGNDIYKGESYNQSKLDSSSDKRPSDDLSTSNRRLKPMENVPLLGIKGYNRDALGFILLDGKIVEWISDDLTGTKYEEDTGSTAPQTSGPHLLLLSLLHQKK